MLQNYKYQEDGQNFPWISVYLGRFATLVAGGDFVLWLQAGTSSPGFKRGLRPLVSSFNGSLRLPSFREAKGFLFQRSLRLLARWSYSLKDME